MQPSAEKTGVIKKQKPDERVAAILDTWLSILHVIGKRVFGPLWMTFFESVQDAIALGLLVKIPTLLSIWVLKKEFSGWNVCWAQYGVWDTSRYACFAVVLSDYTLWAVLIPRILCRFLRDLKKLSSKKETV
ncbi:MAG: hypothetical protein AAFS06_23380 [Cyanobacteria bacterium J06631_12]